METTAPRGTQGRQTPRKGSYPVFVSSRDRRGRRGRVIASTDRLAFQSIIWKADTQRAAQTSPRPRWHVCHRIDTILASSVDVDFKPVRAGFAARPEESPFTSGFDRIRSLVPSSQLGIGVASSHCRLSLLRTKCFFRGAKDDDQKPRNQAVTKHWPKLRLHRDHRTMGGGSARYSALTPGFVNRHCARPAFAVAAPPGGWASQSHGFRPDPLRGDARTIRGVRQGLAACLWTPPLDRRLMWLEASGKIDSDLLEAHFYDVQRWFRFVTYSRRTRPFDRPNPTIRLVLIRARSKPRLRGVAAMTNPAFDSPQGHAVGEGALAGACVSALLLGLLDGCVDRA